MLLRDTSSRTRRSARRGFTLLEILIVVAIIVLLASVSISVAYNYYENSQVNTAKVKAKQLVTAINAYKMDQGEMPGSLQALTQAQGGFKPYAGPADIVDPWNQQYQMEVDGNGDVVVFTMHNGSAIRSNVK